MFLRGCAFVLNTFAFAFSSRGDFAHPDATGAARTSAAADRTAVVEVTGLRPAARYAYQVRIDGAVDRKSTRLNSSH